MKYVFAKKFETGEEAVSIIEDPITLFKNGDYNVSRGDKLYQLGAEVTVETTIKVTSKPVYRGPHADAFKTTFGLKTEDGYNG